MRFVSWLGGRDPGFGALRRAGRAAIALPLLYLLGSQVMGNTEVALFASFGSVAMLLFVDFSGSLRERAQAHVALAVAGAVLVCLGTLASSPIWLSAVAMAVVALIVLFSGSASSVLASASTALLLAFILPVTVPGGIGSLGPRLIGWGIAAIVGLVAIIVLWPAPARDPLRGRAADACRALAARLRAESAYQSGSGDPDLLAERERTGRESRAAVTTLHESFLATPYRPTGLSTPARTVVRLVDELSSLGQVIAQLDRYGLKPSASPGPVRIAARDVRTAAADALDEGAALLLRHGGDPTVLDAARVRLTNARHAVEAATLAEPLRAGGQTGTATADQVVTALDPGFRAQELGFVVSAIAHSIALTAKAERRTWWQRLLGRQPDELAGPVAAATERATGFFRLNSVWLRNSIRGAIALGLAVLLANVTGVQHSFWVVLGALSVLRSNALSTGQTVLRSILGTVVGVAIGAILLLGIGQESFLLWIVLPVAILVAGVAPAAISFAAGQAAFTIVLVVLFNIMAPAGWTVGLVRVEDIGLGCAVSLVVGILFWPRGATAALQRAIADAYLEGVAYLRAAVEFGLRPASSQPVDEPQSQRAAAASRRLDDAFRTYLTERGAKRRPLAEVSAAVTGVASLRSVSDAVLELWRGHPPASGRRVSARRALTAAVEELAAWYGRLAAELVGQGRLPDPPPPGPVTEGRLAAAVLDDVGDSSDPTASTVRTIWMADYLEVVHRLERVIVPPTRVLREDVTPALRKR